MIIFGTRGVTLTGESGSFNCPNCSGERAYKQRKIRRFFTLYWIPVVPLNLLGEYIECHDCKATYNNEVLEFVPEAGDPGFEAEYQVALKKSMAIMVLADGRVDDAEVSMMRDIYSSISGKEISEEDVRKEIEDVRQEGLEIDSYLKKVSSSLNFHGKDLIVKSLLLIAHSDGDFDEEEKSTLTAALLELDISKAELERMMDSTQEE